MNALSLSLFSPGGCSPKPLLAQESWKECLGMKDSLAQEVQTHAHSLPVCVLVSRQSQKSQTDLYTLFVSLDVHPLLISVLMLPFLQESPALPYGSCTFFLACTFLHLFPHPTLAGSIVTLPDHPASFQAWSTWRTGPVFLWTTTRPTHSSAGIPTRTSTSSVRTVQRGPGLSHPCPASTWRKVRAHKVVSGQSVRMEIAPAPGKGTLVGSRAGNRWLLVGAVWPWDGRGRSRGLCLLPQCQRASALFFITLLSKSCLHKQSPALVYAPELWEIQIPCLQDH